MVLKTRHSEQSLYSCFDPEFECLLGFRVVIVLSDTYFQESVGIGGGFFGKDTKFSIMQWRQRSRYPCKWLSSTVGF